MILRFKPNSDKQGMAALAWQNDEVDDVVFGGGAGGGKSFLECSLITLDAMNWPDTRYFIGRKELKQLMATTYITLTQEVFKGMGLVRDYHWKFNGQQSVVYLRQGPKSPWSTISLLDLAHNPQDPLFDRYGSHPFTRGAIEEASEVAFRAYDVLRTRTGRYRNKELGIKGKMLLTLNPSDDWPYRIFYDPWKKAGRPIDPYKPLVSMRAELEGEIVERKFVFIPVLAAENPDLLRDYRVNLATLNDPVLKARLAAGDWEFSAAADVLFDSATIADLFTGKVARSLDMYLTVDVARSADDIVLTYWKGWDAFRIDVIHTVDRPGGVPIWETADLVRSALVQYGIPREHVLVDADGVGGGVFDLLPGVIGFNGGAAPYGVVGEKENKERYENLKTQCMYHLSEKAKARQVVVSDTNLEMREQLAADLKQFKRRDPGKEGKLKAVKKEDIKQALGRSPDVGDTLLMRSYFDLRLREEALQQGGEMKVFIPDY